MDLSHGFHVSNGDTVLRREMRSVLKDLGG
jgi:hypothetical protein